MTTVEQTIRTIILVLISCTWFSKNAFAHPSASITGTASTPSYRVRRRGGVATIREERRHLENFVPSFSADDLPLLEAKMPELTLLMRGLSGETLGEKSYDALQTAMNDYLRKRFEEYFQPRYEFEDVRSKVIGDVPFEGYTLSGGNAISVETVLSFRDPNAAPPEEKTAETESGARQRKSVLEEPTFRASDLFEEPEPELIPQPRMQSSELVPSDLELEIAAGYAWNDLSSFRNHLLVSAAIESLDTFNELESVDSMEDFPTSEELGEEIVVAEDDDGDNDDNDEENEEDSVEEPEPEEPVRGDVIVAPDPGNTLNVAAASSSIQQSGTNRLNPVWPALIVGIAVFLCTTIALGYRKHKARGRDPFGRGVENPDNVMVHIINDKSELQGDEEIEVEDQLYSHPSPAESREKWKKQERDLDKEYATSCLKPATMTLGSSTPPSTSFVSDTEDDMKDENDDGAGRKKKNCFPSIGRRRRAKRVSLIEQDSLAIDSNSSRGIFPPRRVDLTETRNHSSWSYPSRTGEDVNNSNHGDLTKKERQKFTKYIAAGLTVEEASSQVLNERNAIERQLTPPSALSRTRSGDFGGYSQRQGMTREQSNPMECCPSNDNLHSEVMTDGSAVHYERNPSYMSLGAACSSNDPSVLQEILDNNGGANHRNRSNDSGSANARAMVITAASSYASSYNDDDFDVALEEAAAETAFA